MDQSRCMIQADSQALLTGCQPKAEANMRRAIAQVAYVASADAAGASHPGLRGVHGPKQMR